MTVLVDATALASGHRWRGIGTYVRHLISGLVERMPDEARFLTIGPPPDGTPGASIVPAARRVPLRWDDLWALYGRRVHRAIAGSDPSLYHFTSAEASIAGNGLKTLATVYDLIPLETTRRSVDPRNAWRRILYDIYLQRLRSAHHLIAISHSTARSLSERLLIPAQRISVIPLGIDQPRYVERARRGHATVRSAYQLPASYWLTVTSPNPNKGWPDLLQALARNHQLGSATALVITGYWLPSHRRQLLEQANRLGVASLIRFLGFVPDDDLPALYAQALGFVFPSHREGFGLPVLEAMAVGTPVIVSDDPALHELVGDAGLEFPRGDTAALAERMRSLADNAQERARLAQAAARRAAEFTWERTVDMTMSLYRSLLVN